MLAERYFDALVAPRKTPVWFARSAHFVNTEEADAFNRFFVDRLLRSSRRNARMELDGSVRRIVGTGWVAPLLLMQVCLLWVRDMTRRRQQRLFLAFVSAAAVCVVMSRTREALACPDCTTARVVRASVFDESFWTHLVLISMPLIVLGMITALLYRIGIDRPTRASQATTEKEART